MLVNLLDDEATNRPTKVDSLGQPRARNGPRPARRARLIGSAHGPDPSDPSLTPTRATTGARPSSRSTHVTLRRGRNLVRQDVCKQVLAALLRLLDRVINGVTERAG